MPGLKSVCLCDIRPMLDLLSSSQYGHLLWTIRSNSALRNSVFLKNIYTTYSAQIAEIRNFGELVQNP
jgi:hypothetical protein